MLLLGIDLGSSSIKASVIDGESGRTLASAYYPADEMTIIAKKPGWAEQEPDIWWENLKASIADCNRQLGSKKNEIGAVGVSYQMHGLVAIDRNRRVLRPSIIWCDSRAVETGERAFNALGKEYCLSSLLNSPGNFTAAKLGWVKKNEPELFENIYKIMLPGDYIAMKLTGNIVTSYTGLSEGIFWDFKENMVSAKLMEYFGFDPDILPEPKASFSEQGGVLKSAADELGLPEGIPVSYRAGDQPNNALSLNVMDPGEVAATAGTSGVIYGVTDQKRFDLHSRVNTFLHVNHTKSVPRLGVLLCINGTGILNSWLKRNTGNKLSYNEMNDLADKISPGSDGLSIMPFGNGAERMLMNRDYGAMVSGLNFNRHSGPHLYRAGQEGIVFAFRYGLDIMKETGITPSVIRAGATNMFQSRIFRDTLSCITGAEVHLYNTDGSAGAARGAGLGCRYYRTRDDAFRGLQTVGVTYPDRSKSVIYEEIYAGWKEILSSM
jgi:xylulokinase